MIDLNDEKQKYFYLGKCVSGKDIDFYGFKIKQPTVDEIFENEDIYDFVLSPFVLGSSFYNTTENLTQFECVMNSKQTYPALVLALNYFMKIETNNIKRCEVPSMSKKLNRRYYRLVINNSILFDEDKFEDLKKIIFMISSTKEINKDDVGEEDKKEWKFANDEARRKYEQFLKEKEKATKVVPKTDKSVKLVNVYDYVVHSQSVIDYDKVLKMTIYQLYHTYKNLQAKENVTFMYDVASNGLLNSKEKLKSFSEAIVQ